jgi:hypothetical protein
MTDPSRSSPVLLVVVALALAVGAAASLIAGAAAAPAFHSGQPIGLLLTPSELAGIFGVCAAVLIGAFLWVGARGQRSPMPARAAVTLFTIILTGVLFVVVLQAFADTPGSFLSTAPGGSNGTGTAPGSPGNATGNVTVGGPISHLPLFLPPWVLFAAVAIVALVVGAFAVPAMWRRASHRNARSSSNGPSTADLLEVRGALANAAQELDKGSEPRAVVIRLYGTILRRVAPMVGGVDGQTPEEIRFQHLVRLGIRPTAANTLTRLFEEARYSTHPMGPDAATRAADAIREAREDLDRLPSSP